MIYFYTKYYNEFTILMDRRVKIWCMCVITGVKGLGMYIVLVYNLVLGLEGQYWLSRYNFFMCVPMYILKKFKNFLCFFLLFYFSFSRLYECIFCKPSQDYIVYSEETRGLKGLLHILSITMTPNKISSKFKIFFIYSRTSKI